MGTDLRSAGQRPLHVVAIYNQWLAVAKLLVQRGADANLKNHAGQTPREAAEKRLAELNASLAKYAAPPAGGKNQTAPATAGTAESMALFVKGMMSEDAGEKQSIFQQMGANFRGIASAENREKADRLRQIVLFLADAERGKGDFSDIGAICAASVRRHAEAGRKRDKEAKAGITALEHAMKNLTAGFRQMKDDGEAR